MSQVAIAEAAKRLDELVNESQAGREVILTRDDQPIAQIVPLDVPRRHPRKAGSAKDFIHHMAVDFDETPEGFEEYMS